MRVYVFIHAPFEELGAMENWLLNNNHSISKIHSYNNEPLPKLADVDCLIIMGGPQSARHLEQYPYLQREVDFTRQAIVAQKKVLGICLGAQIIAEALNAKTLQSPYKEIGMYPVTLTEAAKQDPVFKNFTTTFPVMHWHGDMPGIAKDAVLLASSAGCPHQAFRYSNSVYGLQFHLEMTKELVAGMIKHCEEDLTAGPYIQTVAELQQLHFAANQLQVEQLLNYLLTE